MCVTRPTYPNAYAKVKKLIFHVEFPGNSFEFGIILNDFLLFRLKFEGPRSKILKFPEFNLVIRRDATRF